MQRRLLINRYNSLMFIHFVNITMFSLDLLFCKSEPSNLDVNIDEHVLF
jgi:hypothetical protein